MYDIIPRTVSNLDPVVRNNNGSLRPALHLEKWCTGHYTGISKIYHPTENVPALIKGIDNAARARAVPAPNEYNYVLAINDDRNIYEYAGRFQSAHSAGENADSVGVLFLLGIGQHPTLLMIDKFKWLRDGFLKPFQVLAPNCLTTPHYAMPGAATSCWGDAINSHIYEIQAPYQKEEDMKAIEPTRLFDKRVAGGVPTLIACPNSGTVFINVTVADGHDGWVSIGNSTDKASLVNLVPGQANSCGTPIGSLGGFYLTATTDCRLIVDLTAIGS